MRNLILLLLLSLATLANAQIVGRSVVIRTNGNPNTITGLDIEHFQAPTLCLDTTTNVWYDFDFGRVPKWQPTHTAENTAATPFSPITSTTVQAQLEEIYAKIPGQSDGGNVLFVSQGTGNNATAQVGNILFPFKDPWAARDTAIAQSISDPVIIVQDGNFSYGFTGSGALYTSGSIQGVSLARDRFTYYCYTGTSFTRVGATSGGVLNRDFCLLSIATINSLTIPNYFNFLGQSNHITNFAVLFLQDELSRNINIELNEVTETAPQPPINYTAGDVNLKINTIINSGGSRIMDFVRPLGVKDTFSINLRLEIDEVKGATTGHQFNWGAATFLNSKFVTKIGKYQNTSSGAISSLTRTAWKNSIVEFSIDELYSPLNIESNANDANNDPWESSYLTYNINLKKGGAITYLGTNYDPASDFILTFNINGIQESNTGTSITLSSNFPNIKYVFTGDLESNRKILNATASTLGGIEFRNLTWKTPLTEAFTVSNFTGGLLALNTSIVSNVANTYSATATITSYGSHFSPFNQSGLSISRITSLGEPTWKTNTFTATAAQTTFTTTPAKLPANGANLVVLVNGLEQTQTTNYTYVPTTGIITWVSPFVGGESVKIRWFD